MSKIVTNDLDEVLKRMFVRSIIPNWVAQEAGFEKTLTEWKTGIKTQNDFNMRIWEGRVVVVVEFNV